MAFKKDDSNAKRIQSWISKKQSESLDRFSRIYKLPVSRLIAIAIENELLNETPFKLDLSLPKEDYIENSFADEAGKITKFMKTLRTGITLDFLYILRHDFGIPDRDKFLAGFKECLEHNLIESYIAPETSKNITGSTLYRLKLNNPKVIKEKRKKVSDYEKYLRLKKKFKYEE